MSILTSQEQLFLDRLATYLPNLDSVGIEDLRAAGELVLSDDRRLVSKIVRDDAFQELASTHLAGAVFDRLNQIPQRGPEDQCAS